MHNLSNRLKYLREKKSLTLDQLAKEVDSTKSYIWELENKEKIRPAAELVYKLAKALEVTVEDLIGSPPKSSDDKENRDDQVFFREYQELKPETKKQIKAILKALKK